MPSSPPVATTGCDGRNARRCSATQIGPTPGTAAAVGHGEGLVEVEVADVGADVARIGQAHLRVHVGAVHVDLSAGVVYGVDDLADAALEDAVRRGIGHHQAAQLRGVLFGLGFEVRPRRCCRLRVARHRDDLHAGHGGRRGVRAVGRRGDQHDVAVALLRGSGGRRG